MGDDALSPSERERVAALADHLAATAERPVERTASRWLGEAAAVADDAAAAAEAGEAPAVVYGRIRQVRELLAEVDATGDGEADERVAAARELAEELGDGGAEPGATG